MPLLQKQFPEVADIYLPPKSCSYRLAVVSMKKQYPGRARRVMMGVWSYLRQFMYTKFVIVVDDDVNARGWKHVIWALTTRTDPRATRSSSKTHRSIIWILPHPSRASGRSWGWNATHKWPVETTRVWGRTITMDETVKCRVMRSGGN